MNKIMKNPKIRQMLAILMLVISMASFTLEVKAHNAFFLQVLIDPGNMEYVGVVMKDDANLANWEGAHMEPKLGDFRKIKEFDSLSASGGFASGVKNFMGSKPKKDKEDAADDIKDSDDNELRDELAGKYKDLKPIKVKNNSRLSGVFTFPPEEKSKPYKNNANGRDADRAYAISDALIPGINEMLYIMNDRQKFDSVEKLVAASGYINGTSQTYNGWNITYSGNKVNISKNGENFSYTYKVTKGYTKKELEGENKKSPVYSSSYEYKDDVDDLTMKDLIVLGNYTAIYGEKLIDDVGELAQTSKLEAKAAEALSSFVYHLRSFLGLYNLDDLIYNKGIRGSDNLYKGALPDEWMDVAVAFHLVFQGITWSLLIFAFIKLIMMKNMSTVNPLMRVSMVDGIKDFLLTGFLLASNLVLIIGLLEFNEKIVDVFAGTVPENSVMSDMVLTGDNRTLGGVFIQLYYLFITIYFNAIYIIRALMLVILIASGPFYIGKIAFGGQSKQLFYVWWRELLSNIFLQSFHSFILSIFLTIQGATRGIVLAVILFSLIPMSKQFQSMMTGGTGFATSMGGATTAAGIGGAAAIGKKMAGVKGSGAADIANKRISQANSDSSGGQGGPSGGGGSANPTEGADIGGAGTSEGGGSINNAVITPQVKTNKHFEDMQGDLGAGSNISSGNANVNGSTNGSADVGGINSVNLDGAGSGVGVDGANVSGDTTIDGSSNTSNETPLSDVSFNGTDMSEGLSDVELNTPLSNFADMGSNDDIVTNGASAVNMDGEGVKNSNMNLQGSKSSKSFGGSGVSQGTTNSQSKEPFFKLDDNNKVVVTHRTQKLAANAANVGKNVSNFGSGIYHAAKGTAKVGMGTMGSMMATPAMLALGTEQNVNKSIESLAGSSKGALNTFGHDFNKSAESFKSSNAFGGVKKGMDNAKLNLSDAINENILLDMDGNITE